MLMILAFSEPLYCSVRKGLTWRGLWETVDLSPIFNLAANQMSIPPWVLALFVLFIVCAMGAYMIKDVHIFPAEAFREYFAGGPYVATLTQDEKNTLYYNYLSSPEFQADKIAYVNNKVPGKTRDTLIREWEGGQMDVAFNARKAALESALIAKKQKYVTDQLSGSSLTQGQILDSWNAQEKAVQANYRMGKKIIPHADLNPDGFQAYGLYMSGVNRKPTEYFTDASGYATTLTRDDENAAYYADPKNSRYYTPEIILKYKQKYIDDKLAQGESLDDILRDIDEQNMNIMRDYRGNASAVQHAGENPDEFQPYGIYKELQQGFEGAKGTGAKGIEENRESVPYSATTEATLSPNLGTVLTQVTAQVGQSATVPSQRNLDLASNGQPQDPNTPLVQTYEPHKTVVAPHQYPRVETVMTASAPTDEGTGAQAIQENAQPLLTVRSQIREENEDEEHFLNPSAIKYAKL